MKENFELIYTACKHKTLVNFLTKHNRQQTKMGSCDSTLYYVAWAIAGVMTLAAGYAYYTLTQERTKCKNLQMMANGYGGPQNAMQPNMPQMPYGNPGPPPGQWGSYAPVPMQAR
jgi:hypothetical protein